MKGSQVYKHGDHAYIIVCQKMIFTFAKTFEAEPDMELVQHYMQWCGADHVLRSPSHFMFCEIAFLEPLILRHFRKPLF